MTLCHQLFLYHARFKTAHFHIRNTLFICKLNTVDFKEMQCIQWFLNQHGKWIPNRGSWYGDISSNKQIPLLFFN